MTAVPFRPFAILTQAGPAREGRQTSLRPLDAHEPGAHWCQSPADRRQEAANAREWLLAVGVGRRLGLGRLLGLVLSLVLVCVRGLA